jgi:hypothetical protein
MVPLPRKILWKSIEADADDPVSAVAATTTSRKHSADLLDLAVSVET